jgi:hypothetical protein
MGYASGTRWTPELIKEKIFEVVDALGLDRMPSQKECSDYFHNGALASAISRRGGWYTLASELGLPIKNSETYFGKRHEQIAQEQLISFGYEVRRMPQNFPYDLLVNDCVKVDVKASRLYRGVNGNFYTFGIEKPYCTCDIYILYLVNDDQSIKDALIIPSKFVFANKQISVGEMNSKYYKYSQNWGYIQSFCSFLDDVV